MEPQRASIVSAPKGYYSASDESSSDDGNDGLDGCEESGVNMADVAGMAGMESVEMRNMTGPPTPPTPIRRLNSGSGGRSLRVNIPIKTSVIFSDHTASDPDMSNVKEESKYRTVTSFESFEAMDSDKEADGEKTLNYGLIKFEDENDLNVKCRGFICANAGSSVDDIAMTMAGKWKMRSPKVILSVVSGIQHSTVFHNSKFAEDFQKGLIKAANSTIMWVLTDGIDFGVPKLVGDAVAEELGRRSLMESDVNMRTADKLPKLTLIAITLKELVNQNTRRGSNESFSRSRGLNTDHTHFILKDACADRSAWVEFRNQLENRFMSPVGRPRKYRRVTSGTSDNADRVDGMNHITPLVAVLLQGGLDEIDHTLFLLKKKSPVLVIKGSGYAADLIAFAYEGLHDRQDADFLATSLKPELLRKIGSAFPIELNDNDALRTLYRDKILELVENSHQEGQTFLTVIDVTQWDSELTNLSEYILTALFKSEKRSTGKQLLEHILRDLQLTLDWNLPDLARSVIFERYSRKIIKVENYLFEQALLLKNREEFVDLFLKYGFQVHTYLNHKRLKHLFENAEDKDLFFGVCLQKVLGKIVDPSSCDLGKDFLEDNVCYLNRLLFKCTDLRNLVNPYELSMNSMGSYVTNRDVAERKAMNILVLWAALTHKIKLAKMLWRKVDDPIPMALLLSNLFHRLAKYCLDRDLRSQLKQHAVTFGSMAVDIFDLSYADSPTQALGILSKALPDYDNRTTLEIAFIGKNRYFISHKCCQRWLNHRWNGMLVIREMDWGLFAVPDWLKIYLSAFLILPMYLWVSFLPSASVNNTMEIELETDEDDIDRDEQEFLLRHLTSIQEKQNHEKGVRWTQGLNTLKKAVVGGRQYRPPLSTQIFLLWSAPITKFWVSQLFYMAYLVLFTIALILPTCGNLYLDLSVFTWTSILLAENCRCTFNKKKRYPEMSVILPTIEVLMIAVFLGFYLFVRIIPHFVLLTGINYEATDYQSAKFVMSIGLLYFYYRLLAVFLPISPTLGPMLINISKMVKVDFFTWFRMFLVFMISGAVTIQAVLYPNHPMTWDMMRKAFSRALFALFLTKIDDLERDDPCFEDYPNATLGFCGRDFQTAKSSPCAYGGIITYVIVIQYLLIVKLVLVTLLFAMFSSTISSIKSEGTQIWKFQRYGLIVEFEQRLRLPPPIIIISYAIILVKFLIVQCQACRQCIVKCCRRRNTRDRVESKRHAKFQGIVHIKRTADFNYWKKCIKDFSKREDRITMESDRPKQDTQLLRSLIEDMGNQKRYNRKLNDRLVLLEKGLTSCLQLMEETKHMIEKMDPKAQGIQPALVRVHIYARQSPYPNTLINRHPVLDKFVSWQVANSGYDPVVYCKKVQDFPEDLQKYVDVDIFSKESSEDVTPEHLPQAQSSSSTSAGKIHARWNAVRTTRIDNMLVEIDRTSWISEDGRTCRYKLDETNLPQNPKGRTGMRGRGCLWRWGPNHSILGVVTRFKMVEEAGKQREVFVRDGQKVLEFLKLNEEDDDEFDLPGGMIHGITSPYSLLCELFMKNVLLEEDVDSRIKLDKDDMVDFFSQFAKALVKPEAGQESDSGFTAETLYRGYLDDTRNTDNAWMETEVWNFHYSMGEEFSSKVQHGKCEWRELSPQTHLHGNQLDIILAVAKIHNTHH